MIYPFLTQITEGLPPPPPMLSAWQMSLDLIFQRIYDPTNSSIRVNFQAAPSGSFGTQMDFEQIVKTCYDPTLDALKVTNETTTPSAPPAGILTLSRLDHEQCFKDAFDPTRQALRVSSLGTDIPVGPLDAPQIIRVIHLFETHSLRVTSTGPASTQTYTPHGWKRALMLAFNRSTGRLRVSTT